MNNRREDIKLPQALLSLRPGAQWSCYGDEYENMVWYDNEILPPTKEEVELEIERLRDEWDYNEYQRLRAKAYPSFAEQFDLLYHGGYDVWKEEINKIKDMYPKPE
jgi:hypothetical protein